MMDGKSLMVGLLMGLCLGVGVYGFYSAQTRSLDAFEALAGSTALGTFGDFEWEILYYQVRTFDIIPYPLDEDFQRMLNGSYKDAGKTVTLTGVTQGGLRDVALGRFKMGGTLGHILVVFETQTIYIQDMEQRDSNKIRFYCWSAI